MSNFDDFLQANERYAATFTKGDVPMPPGRKIAVVACMDARGSIPRSSSVLEKVMRM